MHTRRAGHVVTRPLNCGVSRLFHGIMTIDGFLSFAEGAVKWVNLGSVVFGLGVCAYLSPAFLWPDPGDQHGGGYQLLGVLIVMPATVSAFLTWLSMRRRAAWRWWAQLLPIAMLFGVERLFYTSLGDSAWIYSLVIGLPLIAVSGYAFFGRHSSR
jgi:hypothetical protein